MPEIVDPPGRRETRRFLRRPPLERAEVVDVDVASPLTGKQQRRAVAVPDPVERLERPRLEWTARMLASVFGNFSSPRVKERRT